MEQSGAEGSKGSHEIEEGMVVLDDDALAIEERNGFGVDGFGEGEDGGHERLEVMLLFSVVVVVMVDTVGVFFGPLRDALCETPERALFADDAYWIIIKETLYV